MPYNSLIDRSNDAGALIPEDASREIWKVATLRSLTMQMFERKRMGQKQTRIPVLATKPTAYFVSGDTGLKQTSEQSWTNKYLNAEELAVIVPVPEALLDDVDYDLWAEVKPELEEAIGVAVDDAILFGTNKPSSWPSDLKTAAAAASNTRTIGGGASENAHKDVSAAMKTVEADGFPVNGLLVSNLYRADLRAAQATGGLPLFQSENWGVQSGIADDGRSSISEGRIFGIKALIHEAGLSGFAQSSGYVAAFVGDFRQGIIGIRQDMTYKMLDQAVLQDASGAIVYNLAQQDMVALRVVTRVAWQVPNPPTRMQATEASRYPFATILYP